MGKNKLFIIYCREKVTDLLFVQIFQNASYKAGKLKGLYTILLTFLTLQLYKQCSQFLLIIWVKESPEPFKKKDCVLYHTPLLIQKLKRSTVL